MIVSMCKLSFLHAKFTQVGQLPIALPIGIAIIGKEQGQNCSTVFPHSGSIFFPNLHTVIHPIFLCNFIGFIYRLTSSLVGTRVPRRPLTYLKKMNMFYIFSG